MTDLDKAGTSSAPQDNDGAQNIDSPAQAAPSPSEASAATPQAEIDSQTQADLQSAATPQQVAEAQVETAPQQVATPQPEIAPQTEAVLQQPVATPQAEAAPPQTYDTMAQQPYQATPPQSYAATPQQAYDPTAPQPYGTAPQPYGAAPQPYDPAAPQAYDATSQPYAAAPQPYDPAAPQQPAATAEQATANYAQQASVPQGYYLPNQVGTPYAAGGPGEPAGSGLPGYQSYPYGAYPPPQAQEKPKTRRVWPWVLLSIFVVIILGVGGCVGCVACLVMSADDPYENSYDSDDSDYDYDDSYWDDDYDYGYDDDSYWDDDYDYGYDYDYDSYYDSVLYTYTYDEILYYFGDSLTNHIENGAASNGIYRIGSGLDLEPGEYFLEGDETEEGLYYYFVSSGIEDTYILIGRIVYFGNYFAELAEGDLIVFLPSSADHYMMPRENASFSPTAPYRSGLYLVGTDIPAGTYTATCDTEAADNASDEAAVYIMQDLFWNDDSITGGYYVRTGGNHTIVLEEGMWVEAYAAILTPVD